MRKSDGGTVIMAAEERKLKTKRAMWQGIVLFVAALAIIAFGMVEHTHATVYFGFAAGAFASGRIPWTELPKLMPWGKS